MHIKPLPLESAQNRIFSPAYLKNRLHQAEAALKTVPESITEISAPLSEGSPNDYFSMGDYWWPNPDTADGLPYVQYDGCSNPEAFQSHRLMLRRLRTRVVRLAAGYLLSGNEAYPEHAVRLLQKFFLDPATKMNPNLQFAQAIPGICSGRGIGIIDTLHLIDVPAAMRTLRKSPRFPDQTYVGLQTWFSQYLQWMRTHEYGQAEMNHPNNHSVCWHVQAAVFAWLTNDLKSMRFCRDQYKYTLLKRQMTADGGFPAELKRTKPYAYSIFVVDNMITLCHVLSIPENDLWQFTLPDGRGIAKALDFLYPYLENKAVWPYPPDVEVFDQWPVAMAGFLFAGLALSKPEYVELWQRLDPDPVNMEIRRNMAIREPLLWISEKMK